MGLKTPSVKQIIISNDGLKLFVQAMSHIIVWSLVRGKMDSSIENNNEDKINKIHCATNDNYLGGFNTARELVIWELRDFSIVFRLKLDDKDHLINFSVCGSYLLAFTYCIEADTCFPSVLIVAGGRHQTQERKNFTNYNDKYYEVKGFFSGNGKFLYFTALRENPQKTLKVLEIFKVDGMNIQEERFKLTDDFGFDNNYIKSIEYSLSRTNNLLALYSRKGLINIWYIDKILEELDKLGLFVGINIVYGPEQYDFRHLPKPVKWAIKDKLKASPLNSIAHYKDQLQNLIALLDHVIPGCDFWWPKFWKEVEALDRIRDQRFADVFPEYYEAIKPHLQ